MAGKRKPRGGCGPNVTQLPGRINYTPHRTSRGRFSTQGAKRGAIRYTPNRLRVGEFCDPSKR